MFVYVRIRNFAAVNISTGGKLALKPLGAGQEKDVDFTRSSDVVLARQRLSVLLL